MTALADRLEGQLSEELTRLDRPRPDLRVLEMGMHEKAHGAKFIAWRDDTARTIGRNLEGLEDLHHIPNGGKRDKAVAVQLKREGLQPGVPDYFLPVPVGRFHGLYIELKRPGERARPEQREWLARAEARGYGAVICQGWRQAASAVLSYYLQRGPFEVMQDDKAP